MMCKNDKIIAKKPNVSVQKSLNLSGHWLLMEGKKYKEMFDIMIKWPLCAED